MAWDRDRYLAEVLEPARKAGNVPPADLYVRYGLARNLGDQSAFNRQIAQALACWRELRGRRMYARLAESLIAAHADLEKAGLLTPTGFTEHEAKVRQGLLERLARLARIEAGAATHVGPDVITRLRDALGGAVSDADISSALSRAGVRIIGAYPALPAEPHPKQADLALYLKQLGVRLSAEVVFGPAAGRGFRILGGFRLPDGRTLTVTELDAARSRRGASARFIDRQLALGAAGIEFGQLRLDGPLGPDQRFELGRGQGLTEVKTLILIAADGPQEVELRG